MAINESNSICNLCGCETKLCNSHVIPKFVTDWLKNMSPTDYFRKAIEPNLRMQDGKNIKLLCKECENSFSKLETRCAKELFIPFHEKGKSSFEYEAWLQSFAVMQAWRTSMADFDRFKREQPESVEPLKRAIERWRSFLLKKSNDIGPYEHHLIFLGPIKKAYVKDLPNKFNSYILNSFDATIAYINGEISIYTKLAQLLFWSSVYPPRVDGLEGSLINKNGIIKTSQRISNPGLGDFIIYSARILQDKMSQMSPKQKQRIINAVIKDPERTLSSRQFKLYLYNRQIKNEDAQT